MLIFTLIYVNKREIRLSLDSNVCDLQQNNIDDVNVSQPCDYINLDACDESSSYPPYVCTSISTWALTEGAVCHLLFSKSLLGNRDV